MLNASQIAITLKKQNEPLKIFWVRFILVWCGRRDLNPQGFPPGPKPGASANFATSAK